MKQVHHCFFLLIVLSLLTSCDKEEIKATIPAYLEIDKIEVSNNRQQLGSSSSNIEDAWVFINDRLIGSYELPAVIPILNTGNINLKIRGGIFNNGASNARVIYDLYEFYDTTLLFEKEQTYKPDIKVEYKSETIANDDWGIEDFETGVNFINNSNSDAPLRRITDIDKVFEGDASGSGALGVNDNFFEAYTRNIVNVPRNGLPVYLEFDYKSTHNFQVSVYVNNQSQQVPFVTVRARNEWNKIYLDFSNVFPILFDAANYNISFGYVKPIGEEGELLLDNVKLLHF